MLETFITQKSAQLVYYASRYLRGQLPQAEMHLFIWDTLEEWSQLDVRRKTPESYREMVFWHLLYQLEFWSELEIRQDRQLRRHLQRCAGFLHGKNSIPLDLIGIRP